MIKRLLKLPETQSFFLFGPRGSGKSTLLQAQFKKSEVLWIDLLSQRTEFELSQDPDRLLDLWKIEKPKWIIIDEVQKIPRLLDVVHKGIEEHKIRFALTGSSARKLKRGGANLLAGRAVEKQVFPFCSFELRSNFDLHKSLEIGLLPKLWDETELSKADQVDYLYSYVHTYLKEEIAAEQLVRNLDPFRRFLIAAAQSNSKIVNYSKIERDAGVSQHQASRHFEILVDTLIGFYLEPFAHSPRKRKIQHSKFYFFDTGVVRALQNRAGEILTASSYEYGDLFETFILNEFIKLRSALSLRWNYSYLRTHGDQEIDLIIERPKGLPILVEVKSTTQIQKDDIKSFSRLAKDIKHHQTYWLSNSNDELEIDGVRCIHWQKGLQEIFDLKQT